MNRTNNSFYINNARFEEIILTKLILFHVGGQSSFIILIKNYNNNNSIQYSQTEDSTITLIEKSN